MSTPQTKLTKSVLTTLAYSDHFDFPLTLDEVHLRLQSSEPCSSERVFVTLNSLIKNKQITQTDVYYHLPNRQSLVARRLKFEKLSAPLLARAHHLARLLSSFPTILSIFLTGSLAVNNTNGNADIDLMIITQPKRLWITRFLLTIYTTIFGLRRTPHSRNNSGKLCLNLYLTPMSYELPTMRQSLYTAYELIQAVPLYDPHDTRFALLSANSWLKKYLPNFPFPKPSRLHLVGFRSEFKPTRCNLLVILEYIFFHLQYLYMRPKITREYITKDAAFFHPHDPSPKIISLQSSQKQTIPQLSRE